MTSLLLTRLGYPTTTADARDRLSYWLGTDHSSILLAETATGVGGVVHAFAASNAQSGAYHPDRASSHA